MVKYIHCYRRQFVNVFKSFPKFLTSDVFCEKISLIRVWKKFAGMKKKQENIFKIKIYLQ